VYWGQLSLTAYIVWVTGPRGSVSADCTADQVVRYRGQYCGSGVVGTLTEWSLTTGTNEWGRSMQPAQTVAEWRTSASEVYTVWGYINSIIIIVVVVVMRSQSRTIVSVPRYLDWYSNRFGLQLEPGVVNQQKRVFAEQNVITQRSRHPGRLYQMPCRSSRMFQPIYIANDHFFAL